MNVYIAVDESAPSHLASNSGWGEFAEWVDELDAPKLKALIDNGFTEDIDDVNAELTAALKEHEPNEDVESTAAELLEWLTVAKKSGILMITDGSSPDGEGDEGIADDQTDE
jgi:hypothetical protein